MMLTKDYDNLYLLDMNFGQAILDGSVSVNWAAYTPGEKRWCLCPKELKRRVNRGQYAGYPWTEARVRRKYPQLTFVWPISIALFREQCPTSVICLFATQIYRTFTRNLIVCVVLPRHSSGFSCFLGSCFGVTAFVYRGLWRLVRVGWSMINFKDWER